MPHLHRALLARLYLPNQMLGHAHFPRRLSKLLWTFQKILGGLGLANLRPTITAPYGLSQREPELFSLKPTKPEPRLNLAASIRRAPLAAPPKMELLRITRVQICVASMQTSLKLPKAQGRKMPNAFIARS